eukprot:364541-Chlamydomonas_euryale.AAC.7
MQTSAPWPPHVAWFVFLQTLQTRSRDSCARGRPPPAPPPPPSPRASLPHHLRGSSFDVQRWCARVIQLPQGRPTLASATAAVALCIQARLSPAAGWCAHHGSAHGATAVAAEAPPARLTFAAPRRGGARYATTATRDSAPRTRRRVRRRRRCEGMCAERGS